MRQRVLLVPAALDGATAREIVEKLGVFPSEVAMGLLDAGCLSAAGRLVESSAARFPTGARLVLTYDPHTHYRPRPAPRRGPACTIIYEDPAFLVVDKDAGIPMEPDAGPPGSSLAERLASELAPRPPRVEKTRGLYAVHLPDAAASGLVIFARRVEALWGLVPQFDGATAKRSFTAFVRGVPDVSSGVVRPSPQRRRPAGRREDSDSDARPAITRWRVIESYGKVAVLRVESEKGRADRILTALAEAGHPVIGDPARDPIEAPIDRAALHCVLLEFEDPVRSGRLSFRSALPFGLERLYRQLRGEAPIREEDVRKPDVRPEPKVRPAPAEPGGRPKRPARSPGGSGVSQRRQAGRDRPPKAAARRSGKQKFEKPAGGRRSQNRAKGTARNEDGKRRLEDDISTRARSDNHGSSEQAETRVPARKAPKAAWLKKREATRSDPSIPEWAKARMGLRKRRSK